MERRKESLFNTFSRALGYSYEERKTEKEREREKERKKKRKKERKKKKKELDPYFTTHKKWTQNGSETYMQNLTI